MSAKRKVLRFGKKNVLEEVEEKGRAKDKEKSNRRFLETISLASQMGFSISLPIVAGALLGHFLDSRFNTSPRMTLSLIFLGLIVAAGNIYTVIKRINQD